MNTILSPEDHERLNAIWEKYMVHGMADKTCVPISLVRQHLREMRNEVMGVLLKPTKETTVFTPFDTEDRSGE